MLLRTIKTILFLICVIGLFFIPMSNIFLYNESMAQSSKDFIRVVSEEAKRTDYHSSDISTFVNDYFIFYVPPPSFYAVECGSPRYSSHYTRSYYNPEYYHVGNLSSLQLFSYENGAEVKVEWLNGTAMNGTWFDTGNNNNGWEIESHADMKWLDDLPGPKILKKKYKLGEYETEEIQLSNWTVFDENNIPDYNDYRLLSGVVKITSDFPITVMHHKLYPTDTRDVYNNNKINNNWDGVYSFYGKKLFTRITGDCWISALEANTMVHVWDYSDKNDDVELQLDRFEGWAYSRNAVFEQYGFDDDLVLIAADKPISVVAGLQSDQSFVQVFGKDGKDFKFPCFGFVLIHAPTGSGKVELKDPNGNQGSDTFSLNAGEMRIADFKVAYKQRYYSSFEWAQITSSDPIYVYTFANSSWHHREYDSDLHYNDRFRYEFNGMISGEEYITKYKKITEFYSHGYVPYPADTEFKLPIRSRATVTVVNLDNGGNDVEVDFKKLNMPYKTILDSHESVTLEFSEHSYYRMDLVNPQTGTKEDSAWLKSDPRNYYYLDRIPRITLHDDDTSLDVLEQKVSWENITKGSTVKIKADHPVLVLLDYNRDQPYAPQGIDLIPGLTPPSFRGLPDFPAALVFFSGLVIAVDMIVVAIGKKSMVEIF